MLFFGAETSSVYDDHLDPCRARFDVPRASLMSSGLARQHYVTFRMTFNLRRIQVAQVFQTLPFRARRASPTLLVPSPAGDLSLIL